ncbi:NAD-dependent succinate-semialdehyde dehydrogenase [Devriesea agamarum]|uniref:NAD-dependent succinate-semialdehyde dehydrogenase n=1 Tax=Devriesea agamarum TaxID=472569 RepID=UPI00071E215C|nr:NAD-dependent succinate-semialdehyde dehydrogenase [Devriesea agamarum]
MPSSPATQTTHVTPSQVEDLLARMPRSSFIGGAFTGGTPSLSVIDPATEQSILSVVDASPDLGTLALDAACDAAPAWAATTARERSTIVRRAFELCHERADDLALTMTLEMGKPLAESYGEVSYGAEFLRWFSEEGVRAPGHFGPAPASGKRMLTLSKPVGPVLAITPWNFPLAMGTRKIAPALAAGCTVVVKPARQTPLTMLLFLEILRDAGLPDGVVNCVVTSHSREISTTLLADPRLRKLTFTGSTEVGRTLLAQAADRVLKTSMELGGNAPFLVMPSADIDVAVEAAMPAKFRNNGEACTAANRFYVHSSRLDEFTDKFVAKVRKLVVGPGLDRETTLGPLINAEGRDKAEQLIADATQRGAQTVAGGQQLDRPGFFLEPTVLTNVPADARICHEEVFAPVAPIIACDDPEAMIAAANDTEFGLMAYVMAADLDEALSTCERLESGMIGLNSGVVSDPAAPFGGVKESGLGREGGHAGLAEYLETCYIGLP